MQNFVKYPLGRGVVWVVRAASHKTEFLSICYFWRMKRKLTKTSMERCFSCQNKRVDMVKDCEIC